MIEIYAGFYMTAAAVHLQHRANKYMEISVSSRYKIVQISLFCYVDIETYVYLKIFVDSWG